MSSQQIGYCQRCGVLDHYLVHDLCAPCEDQCLEQQKNDQSELGVEAADIDSIIDYDEVKHGA